MTGLEIILKLMSGMLMLLQFRVALGVQLVIRYAFPFLVSTDLTLHYFHELCWISLLGLLIVTIFKEKKLYSLLNNLNSWIEVATALQIYSYTTWLLASVSSLTIIFTGVTKC